MNSRKAQNTIAVVILVVGLLALLFQNSIWDWWYSQSLRDDSRPSIAEISDITKTVKYRLPESLTYRRARLNMPLHPKDTVATEDDSTAVITFKSGLKVELEPNSLITIQDYGSGPGQLELTFLRGSVKVLNQAEGINLSAASIKKPLFEERQEDVKLDLNLLAPAAPSPTPIAALPKIELEEKRERKPPPKKKKIEEKETLPDSYIASVIRNQKTFLSRCYAQYLRLNPDARGRIDCSLTIEPDGSISSARVVGSSIPDPALQQCVVSTLQRARFKSFNGDPIVVNYPINFE